MTTALAELRDRLPDVMLRDRSRLASQLDRASRRRDPAARQRALRQLAAELDAAAGPVMSPMAFGC